MQHFMQTDVFHEVVLVLYIKNVAMQKQAKNAMGWIQQS